MTGGTRRRVTVTFLDQAVSSLSNFGTGVVVARVAGPAEFGYYMIAFMVWVVVVGVHRALVTEPLIVGTRDTDGRWVPLAEGATADLVLGLGVSSVVAIAGAAGLALGVPFSEPLLALSPWLVALLVQDYWRAVAFQRRQPGLALANDLVFVCVQVLATAAVLALGWRSVAWIIAAWGLGAVSGAAVGFRCFGGLSAPREAGRLLRRLWPTSRWMLADFTTGFSSDQAYLLFAAMLLTSTDYGGFRAAFSLMGPTVVILLSGGNIGLPEAARRAGSADRGSLRSYTRGLTVAVLACVAAYGAVVALTSRRLLDVVYGPEFVDYHVLVVLSALRFVIAATVFGHLITLKAVGRIRHLWRARIVIAAVSLVSMVVLIRWMGVDGAGWSGVTSGLCYAVVVFAIYRREMRGAIDAGDVDPVYRGDELDRPSTPTAPV